MKEIANTLIGRRLRVYTFDLRGSLIDGYIHKIEEVCQNEQGTYFIYTSYAQHYSHKRNKSVIMMREENLAPLCGGHNIYEKNPEMVFYLLNK